MTLAGLFSGMVPVREVREVPLRWPRFAVLAVAAAALALLASSCRVSPFSPARDLAVGNPLEAGPAAASGLSPSPARPAGDPVDPRAPRITRLRGEVRNGTLFLTGQLVVPGPRSDLEYSPYEPGGWCLQVFLNTDQQRTGYWRGYDYVVRGVEWDARSGAAVVRRITLESGYPGGWGPSSGQADLRVSRGSFAVAVPLRTLGGDDGNLDFGLELYATVACPECETGTSQEYVADYFGVCAPDGGPARTSGPIALAERTQRPARGAGVSAADAGR